MAVIKPFKALRFDQTKAGPLADVTAPPYDVISPGGREQLARRSAFNMVHLTLPAAFSGESERDNRYSRAAALLRGWEAEGVVRTDSRDALYVYDQYFELGGKEYRRRALIARVLLEPFGAGSIFPHERTLSGPKEDRLRLMRACRANLSQVFAIHEDPEEKIGLLLAGWCGEREPAAGFIDEDEGVRHVLWAIGEGGVISELVSLMGSLPLYIADGHHRYETALKLRDEIRGGGPPGSDPADYVSVACVSCRQPGLVILPAHRALKVGKIEVADFIGRLKGDFEAVKSHAVCAGEFRKELCASGCRGFIGLYLPGAFHLIRARSYEEIDRRYSRHCESWRRLDVTALHVLVIEKQFGIPFELEAKPEQVEYVKDMEETVTAVDEGRASAAFLLNPTNVDEVMAVARAGDRMPPKSTYFHPKLISGLVLNALR